MKEPCIYDLIGSFILHAYFKTVLDLGIFNFCAIFDILLIIFLINTHI